MLVKRIKKLLPVLVVRELLGVVGHDDAGRAVPGVCVGEALGRGLEVLVGLDDVGHGAGHGGVHDAVLAHVVGRDPHRELELLARGPYLEALVHRDVVAQEGPALRARLHRPAKRARGQDLGHGVARGDLAEAPGHEAVHVHGAYGAAQERHVVLLEELLEGPLGGLALAARHGDALGQTRVLDDGEALLDHGLAAAELQQEVVGLAEVHRTLALAVHVGVGMCL